MKYFSLDQIRILMFVTAIFFSKFSVAETSVIIYFDFDKYELKPSEFKKIQNTNFEDKFSYHVEGYTDLVGSESYNHNLSDNRAQIVRSEILKKSKNINIEVSAKGMDVSDKLLNWQKRRVVITRLEKNEDQLAVENSGSKDSLNPVSDFNEEIAPNSIPNANGANEQDVMSTNHNDKKGTNLYRYNLGLGLYQNQLNVESKTSGPDADWISRVNTNLLLNYQIKIKKIWLGLGAGYHIQKYRIDNNPSYNWNKKQPRLLKLSVIADYELTQWAFGFNLDFNQETFWHEELTQVDLKKISMFGVTGRAQYKWLERKKWSSRVGASIEFPFLGSNSINPEGGLGVLANFDLTRHLENKTGYNFGMYLGFRNLSSDRMDQKENIFGFNMKYISDFWF